MFGKCRAHPPTVTGSSDLGPETEWPDVTAKEWCGEWQGAKWAAEAQESSQQFLRRSESVSKNLRLHSIAGSDCLEGAAADIIDRLLRIIYELEQRD